MFWTVLTSRIFITNIASARTLAAAHISSFSTASLSLWMWKTHIIKWKESILGPFSKMLAGLNTPANLTPSTTPSVMSPTCIICIGSFLALIRFSWFYEFSSHPSTYVLALRHLSFTLYFFVSYKNVWNYNHERRRTKPCRRIPTWFIRLHFRFLLISTLMVLVILCEYWLSNVL